MLCAIHEIDPEPNQIMKNDQSLNKYSQTDIWILVLAKLTPWLFLGMIVLIGFVRSYVGPKVDPRDNSYMKTFAIVDHVNVLDSSRNGFRVVYVTTQAVTDERLDEIRERENIRDAFYHMQKDALPHFGGSLLHTDIYDFAAFAKEYDQDDDIRIHNIFVSGFEKMKLYIGPNSNFRNPAKWMDMGTEQGNQYLDSHDIYFRTTKDRRIYRYWKCMAPYHISLTDERFSHFSEDERLY